LVLFRWHVYTVPSAFMTSVGALTHGVAGNFP
jgi:hypothetical protein